MGLVGVSRPTLSAGNRNPRLRQRCFEYCLDDYWRRYRESDATIALRDVAMAPFSVGQVFKLPEDDVRCRLDAYVLTDSAAPFRYQPSAVQGLIFRRDGGTRDFLAAVYAQEADYA